MRTDFYWTQAPTPGRIAVMARPRGGDWLANEIDGWKRTGVGVMVSLLTADEEAEFDLTAEAALVGKQSIRFEALPIEDRGVPESREAVAQLVSRLAADLAEGKTVAIHCRQGIGRAGLLAACVLMMLGLDEETAVRRVEVARGRPVPETPEQRRWIAKFAAHLPQPAR